MIVFFIKLVLIFSLVILTVYILLNNLSSVVELTVNNKSLDVNLLITNFKINVIFMLLLCTLVVFSNLPTTTPNFFYYVKSYYTLNYFTINVNFWHVIMLLFCNIFLNPRGLYLFCSFGTILTESVTQLKEFFLSIFENKEYKEKQRLLHEIEFKKEEQRRKKLKEIALAKKKKKMLKYYEPPLEKLLKLRENAKKSYILLVKYERLYHRDFPVTNFYYFNSMINNKTTSKYNPYINQYYSISNRKPYYYYLDQPTSDFKSKNPLLYKKFNKIKSLFITNFSIVNKNNKMQEALNLILEDVYLGLNNKQAVESKKKKAEQFILSLSSLYDEYYNKNKKAFHTFEKQMIYTEITKDERLKLSTSFCQTVVTNGSNFQLKLDEFYSFLVNSMKYNVIGSPAVEAAIKDKFQRHKLNVVRLTSIMQKTQYILKEKRTLFKLIKESII